MASHLAEWRDFIRSSAHILSVHPSLLFQQAANLPADSAPSAAANTRWRSGRERRPWFRVVGATASAPTCRLAITGHTGQVHACAFSPDGLRIASTAGDGTVRLWEVETGRELLSLEADDETDWAPVFLSRDRVLIHGPDNSLRLHDSRSGTLTHLLEGNGHPVTCSAMTADERLLLAGDSEGNLRLWDLRQNRLRAHYREHANWIRSCAFSADGRRFATSSWDMTARLWNTDTGAVIAEIEGTSADAAQTLAFLRNSRTLVVASGLTLQLLDTDTGRVITSFRVLETGGTNIVFTKSPDEDLILVACAGLLRIHDAHTLAPGAVLGRHESGQDVTSLAISPDGRLLASAGFDETVLVWNLGQPGEAMRLVGHTEVVRSVAFSPDGRLLASASWDQTIRLWDVTSINAGPPDNVEESHFTPGGYLALIVRDKRLLGVDSRGYAFTQEFSRLQIRDVRAGVLLPSAAESWCNAAARDWIVSPSKSAALIRDREAGVRVIRLDTGHEVASLAGAQVDCFAALPEEHLLVTVEVERRSGALHQRIHLRDMKGKETDTWWLTRDHRVGWCDVAAGGEVIVTIDEVTRRLRLWSAADGRERNEFEVHVLDPPCVLSRDGRRISFLSSPATLHVIDALTGESVGRLSPESAILDWVMTRGGERVVTVSADGAVIAWDVEGARAIERHAIAAHLGRGVRLSPQATWLIDLPESEWARGNKHVSQHIELRAVDVLRSEVAARFFADGDIGQAEWSPDGTRVAVVTNKGLALLLALEAGDYPDRC